jgi:hypothetical protein
MAYETAAGDVVPSDILEYFKHADVPMCEFWQPSGKQELYILFGDYLMLAMSTLLY